MESLNEAIKRLPQSESQAISVRRFKKQETLPKCVTAGESLIEFYNKTDVEFTYIYAKCMELVPLKGIEITLQMVEFWFREFIKAGWNKRWFDKQLKAIKQKQVFGRIDIADWFNAEVMYNELDFNIRVNREIDKMIKRGQYLKEHPEIELTEEDKKCLELEITHELEFKRKNDLLDKKETWKQERKRLILEKFNG